LGEDVKMIDYKVVFDSLKESDLRFESLVIIKGKDNIVYSSDNWDITEDLRLLLTAWSSPKVRVITIEGIKYVILQKTGERLIAVSYSARSKDDPIKYKRVQAYRSKLVVKGSIVGFKDEDHLIIGKLPHDGHMNISYNECARAVRLLSSEKPYMNKKVKLGKDDKFNERITPKILFDTSKFLQQYGLLKFGLSPEEAKVYLAILEKEEEGEKVGNLYKKLGIKRTTVYPMVERLIKKDFIEKPTIASLLNQPQTQTVQKYIARPIVNILEELIQEKKDELMNLEIIYNLIHKDMDEQSKTQISEQEDTKLDSAGIPSLIEGSGFTIFRYAKDVEEDKIIAQTILQLSIEKLKVDIEQLKLSGFQELRIYERQIQDYFGADIFLIFTDKEDQQISSQVIIPKGEKMYLVYGLNEEFKAIIDLIQSLK